MHDNDEFPSTFLEAMKDVKPLPKSDTVESVRVSETLAQRLKREALEKEQQTRTNYLSVEKVDPVEPLDHLSYKKPGVQEGVFKNLRLGKYKVDATLNVTQIRFESAREAVFNCIDQAQQKGIRTLLIHHGLGQHSKPFPAFMKSYVRQWLCQMPQVLAFHSALRQHGGLAAVYVLIKKSDQEKLANKELNRRR